MLVYGIHPGDPAEMVADFIEQTGVTYPILSNNSTKGLFNFPGGVGYPYPRDIVIDKDLKVRSIKNSFNVEEMDALIQSLIDD